MKTSKINTDKKTKTIAFRCTPEKDKQIAEKAKHFAESKSAFISDCVEMGLEKRTKRDKKRVVALVQNQERMDQLISGLDSGQMELKEKLIEYSKGELGLWEF